MNQRIFNLAIVICLVIVALFSTFSVIRSDPVASAQTVSAYRTITLLNETGITQTANGTGVYIPDLGVADCYSRVTVASAQTATVALQHSANNANWITLLTYAGAITTGVDFTHTALYGNYTRATVTLGTSNPITVVVQCVAKNL